MSWNKQTSNYSSLDQIKKIAEDLGYKCSVSVIETVRDRSAYCDDEIILRRLSFEDQTRKVVVVLEQLTQTEDCDLNDYIESYTFDFETEPKDWKPIIREETTYE